MHLSFGRLETLFSGVKVAGNIEAGKFAFISPYIDPSVNYQHFAYPTVFVGYNCQDADIE